jgi:hypothetical protein
MGKHMPAGSRPERAEEIASRDQRSGASIEKRRVSRTLVGVPENTLVAEEEIELVLVFSGKS